MWDDENVEMVFVVFCVLVVATACLYFGTNFFDHLWEWIGETARWVWKVIQLILMILLLLGVVILGCFFVFTLEDKYKRVVVGLGLQEKRTAELDAKAKRTSHLIGGLETQIQALDQKVESIPYFVSLRAQEKAKEAVQDFLK